MTPRIPIPPPTLDPLPLTSAQVTKLADQWGGEQRAHWLQAWSDIVILARRFMEYHPDHGPSAAMAWHHLLMAAGNFKRSRRIHHPCGTRRIHEPG